MSLKSEMEMDKLDSVLCIENDSLRINQKYINELEKSENGFCVLNCGPEYGNLFMKENGQIVLWGVVNMDNDADQFKYGLVRIKRNGKWGYADKKGKIIIKPEYDGAMPFDKGVGMVCVGCIEKCVENSNCEYHFFDGGIWYFLDRHGKVIEKTDKTKKDKE
jgi:hypothetical protein